MRRAVAAAVGAVLLALPTVTVAQGAGHRHDPAPQPPPAEAPAPDGERPSLRAVRIETAPRIDGLLDEAVWASANVVDRFVQQEPQEGQPATDRTEVRVLFDRNRLYIGVRAYAALPVTATEMRRDADRLFDEDNSRSSSTPSGTRATATCS